jgi:RES domain-containing protein
LRFSGKVWRHLPSGAHPLHARYILYASGRWNRALEYGCLYTALTPEGARAEYEKYRTRAQGPGSGKPRDLVSIEVTATPVLDLTDETVRTWLGVTLSSLIGDEEADLESCRSIADWARSEGYRAILAPSAAREGERVLAIYIEGPVRDLDWDMGPDRIPLNY